MATTNQILQYLSGPDKVCKLLVSYHNSIEFIKWTFQNLRKPMFTYKYRLFYPRNFSISPQLLPTLASTVMGTDSLMAVSMRGFMRLM